jgi:hypothetical protein
MSDILTDRDFWLNYWETQPGTDQAIPAKTMLYEHFANTLKKHPHIKTAIELGGFPGTYSVYLKKYHGLDTALLDFVIHPQVFEKFLSANGVAKESIKTFEADLFDNQITDTFDLVYSIGLIEHFLNTESILKTHLQFISSNGILFVMVPNFNGLNGWLQKKVDREFYDKHYLDCMHPERLIEHAKKLGLVEIESGYIGGFSLWLEDADKKPFWLKAAVKPFWLVGKIISKLIPVQSRLFSPYTYLLAKKP